MCKRYIDQLPLACPLLGIWPATQVCALTGNQTTDLPVLRLALNPLIHISQGTVLPLYTLPLSNTCSNLSSVHCYVLPWFSKALAYTLGKSQ